MKRPVLKSIILLSTIVGTLGVSIDPRFDLAGANGPIRNIELFRGDWYVAGSFSRIDGVAAPGIARWNGTRWQALTPPGNCKVWSAAASTEANYFLPVCCQANAGIIRWDGQNWRESGFPKGHEFELFPDNFGDEDFERIFATSLVRQELYFAQYTETVTDIEFQFRYHHDLVHILKTKLDSESLTYSLSDHMLTTFGVQLEHKPEESSYCLRFAPEFTKETLKRLDLVFSEFGDREGDCRF